MIFISFLIIAFLNSTMLAQPDSLWSNVYGGMSNDYCYHAIQTQDGGYALVGAFESYPDDLSHQFCLVKTDAQGEEEWMQTWGGQGFEVAWAVTQTTDRGFLVVGYTNTDVFGSDGWVVKTDSEGELEWSQNYGDGSVGIFRMIKVINDSAYIIAGYGNTADNNSQDCWLVKIDDEGEVIWSHTYGGDSREWCQDVDRTRDGGFVLSGITISFGAGGSDAYVIKVDEDGDEEWSRTYGTERDEGLVEIVQMPDGGYVFAGSAILPGDDENRDMYVVRVDSSGEEIWTHTYGGRRDDNCYALTLTPDGGIILAGKSDTEGRNYLDFYIVRFNFQGEVLWQRTFGGRGIEECNSIIRTPDGSYALGGHTDYFRREGVRNRSFWLVKTGPDILRWLSLPDTGFVEDSTLIYDLDYFYDFVSPSVYSDSALVFYVRNGVHVNGEIEDDRLIITDDEGEFGLDSLRLIVAEEDDEDNRDTTYLRITIREYNDVAQLTDSCFPQKLDIKIAYPNPFNSSTSISYQLPAESDVTITILDISGREIKTLINGTVRAGYHQTIWNADVPSGIYICRMETDGYIKSIKLLLTR